MTTPLPQGSWALGASLIGTATSVSHVEECPDIGPICAERDEPPQIQEQGFWLGELRAQAEYGVADGLGLELQVPLRFVRTSIAYHRLDGTPFQPDYPSIHHRNETLVGPGDPWLSARPVLQLGRVTLAGRLGVTLPLGATEENPFRLGTGGEQHQHVQFGTGTFDLVIGADAVVGLGRFSVRGYGLGQLGFYENGHGYRAGNRYLGGALGQLGLGALAVSLGPEVLHEQAERWDGRIEAEGNIGRTDLLVAANLSWAVGRSVLLLSAKVPVYQRFPPSPEPAPSGTLERRRHGGADEAQGQLTYPVIVVLGYSLRL